MHPATCNVVPRSGSRDAVRWCTTVQAANALYPRGPRSGPGCSVPVHPHLIGPMRPTHRHSSISPQSGLYGLPSLCTLFPCLGDPRVVPCFRWPAISTCRPLRPREAHRLRSSSSFTDGAGLRPEVKVSALPTSPPSDSREGQYFGAWLRFAFATTCRIARPSVGADRAFAQPQGLLLPGFQRIGHPLRRRL